MQLTPDINLVLGFRKIHRPGASAAQERGR
jgi:hypothetical protein